MAASEFLPVFVGWNVWTIFQTQSLDFELMMIGVDRDTRLKIFVEDAVRLGAPAASVADPLALKGSQVEILRSVPEDLETAKRKEDVPGPALVVNGPAELRVVRFFNRGKEGALRWPHSSNYLVDRVFTPAEGSEATKGQPAPTVFDSTGIASAASTIGTGAILLVLAYLVLSKK